MSTFFSHAFGNSTSINDNNFNELVQFGVTSSAVNFVKITNSATNSNVAITAAGGDSHIGLDIAAKGDRGVNFTSSTSNSSHIKLYETSTNGSGYVGLRAPTSVSANYILTFPSKDGDAGQVLQTNGTGTLSFTTALTNGTSAFNVSDGGTIGSATVTDAMTLSSNGDVIFKDNIKIQDGGTIGCNKVGDAMTIASDGIVTFKDDIKIKDGGTIGSATTADAITLASNGMVSVEKGLILTPLVITSVSTNIGSPDTINLLNSVVYYDVNETSAMYAQINAGPDGKLVHIFYDNAEPSGSLRINFGSLRSGSGDAQYLTFNQTGQSASLMFIKVSNKWCILNTGAAVS